MKTEDQLNQQWANFFCEEPDGKYVRLCRPHNLWYLDHLQELQDPVNTDNAGPLFKIITNFKMAAADTKANTGPF